MKKLLLYLVILLPILSKAQDKDGFYLTFNSNIQFAPVGLGFIATDEHSGISFFVQGKISEDFFTRNVITGTASNHEDAAFDVNEVIVTAGVLGRITNNIGVYFGIGGFGGSIYQRYRSTDSWIKSEDISHTSPAITYGITLKRKRVIFMMGADVAFVKSGNYPIAVLNKKSVGRLTGLTIGVGFNLAKEE